MSAVARELDRINRLHRKRVERVKRMDRKRRERRGGTESTARGFLIATLLWVGTGAAVLYAIPPMP